MSNVPAHDASSATDTISKMSIDKPSFSIELKKTKIIWAQPPIAAALTWTETMMDLVKFRNWLEDRVANSSAGVVDTIPGEHLGLIAKLVQESDKDLKTLTSEIHTSLSPEPMGISTEEKKEKDKDGGVLLLKAVESGITTVAKRVNYGLDGGLQNFCIWRWEVEDVALLPERMRGLISQRKLDRQKGQTLLRSLYLALPDSEKKGMLLKSKAKKLESTTEGKEDSAVLGVEGDAMVIDPPAASTSTFVPNKVDPESPVVAKAKKEEKDPKEKTKKATNGKAKETAPVIPAKGSLLGYFAPKERKIDTPTKRKLDPSTPGAGNTDGNGESVVEKPKPKFDEIFQPFRVRKNVTVAPINWFKAGREVIVLDGDEGEGRVTVEYMQGDKDQSPLEAIKASSSRPRATIYPRLHPTAPPLKTVSTLSVRDLIEQLNDATESGDVTSAKRLISTLADRKRLPLRFLHFWENTRPMYIGTWTKTSTKVGPRSPWAKEDGVDYEWDSGEEWEEEEDGEEMEDLDALDGDEEDDSEEGLGDFMVPDDEVEDEEDDDEGIVLEMEGEEVKLGKRKREGGGGGWGGFGLGGRRSKKIKVLKPNCKGPLWEDTLGVPKLASWGAFAIRVLNDTPLFIDPLVPYGDAVKIKPVDTITAVPDRLLSGSGVSSKPIKRRYHPATNVPKPQLPENLRQQFSDIVLNEENATKGALIQKGWEALKSQGATRVSVQGSLEAMFEKPKGSKKFVLKEVAEGGT